jgi:GTP-binding protein LepA
MLQLTGTISDRDMTEQVLDSMDLEREKGVTIKASAVRMSYTAQDGQSYELNLIDTPGHVDFGYEVSRALAACEGAVLVVDASQGIEAQTLANLYLALEADLEVIPVINKIDLISARPDEVADEVSNLLGTPAEKIIRISAKAGLNVEAVLEAIVTQVPPQTYERFTPGIDLRHYDSYKGVVAYIRVMDGEVCPADNLLMMASGVSVKPVEIGIFAPSACVRSFQRAGEHSHRPEDRARMPRAIPSPDGAPDCFSRYPAIVKSVDNLWRVPCRG